MPLLKTLIWFMSGETLLPPAENTLFDDRSKKKISAPKTDLPAVQRCGRFKTSS